MFVLPPVQAFKQGPDADNIFFAELTYENSKELYKRLNVKALPFIFHWGPESSAKEGRSIKLSKSSQVRASGVAAAAAAAEAGTSYTKPRACLSLRQQ